MEDRHRRDTAHGTPAVPAGQHSHRSPDRSPTGLSAYSVGAWSSASADNSGTLTHQLSERLTAATNYLRGLEHLAGAGPRGNGAPALETLVKALAQLEEAGLLIKHIRSMAGTVSPASHGAGCRHNSGADRLAQGDQPMIAPHNTIGTNSATSHKTTTVTSNDFSSTPASIRDWHKYALMAAFGLFEDEARQVEREGTVVSRATRNDGKPARQLPPPGRNPGQ
jgi:hypothetical protein